MTGCVALLPGHGAKPTGWDPGARSPAGWSEAELVRDVTAVAWRELERRRCQVEIVGAGSYAQRGAAADAGPRLDVIVQLHADASPADVGPDVGRVFHWPRNAAGATIARAIAAELGALLPWPVHVVAAEPEWGNARACLAAVRGTSVLVELGFTDGVEGRVVLPDRATDIGLALARALAQR